MCKNVLAKLNADATTVERATWEASEFELEAPGIVIVRSASYLEPEEHSYRVDVEGGIPVACECPAFEYNGSPCRHCVAVAIRESIMIAAQAEHKTTGREVIADGGINSTWNTSLRM